MNGDSVPSVPSKDSLRGGHNVQVTSYENEVLVCLCFFLFPFPRFCADLQRGNLQ